MPLLRGVSCAAVLILGCGGRTSYSGLGSHDGSPVDATTADGDVPDGSLVPPAEPDASQAAAVLYALSLQQQLVLLAGEPSGCPGNANLTNIFTTPGVYGVVGGLQRRDGTRGVCLAANLPPEKTGYSTAFPVAALRGATFDYDLEAQIGAALGDEVVAAGHNVMLAPALDVLRHPAWGRAQEMYGEDSFLLGRLGTALTLGIQEYIPACAEFFVGYSIEKGGNADTSQMDEQTLYEIYGRPFEMVIHDGGVACIVAALNLVQSTDGPDKAAYKATVSHELLIDMLRTTFGFAGFVESDMFAMPGTVPGCSGLPPSTQAQIAAEAINAGLDLELPRDEDFTQLLNDVDAGTVSPAQITTAAELIVGQQIRFNILTGNGLKAATAVQDPATFNITNDDSHQQLARQAATEGMVLLKNDKSTLPIPSTAKTVAVIGATVAFTVTDTDVSEATVDFTTNIIAGSGFTTGLTGDLGDSRVYSDPTQFVGPLAGITRAAAALGMTVVTGADPASIPAADFYVVVAGLTPEDEGEDYTGGSDRVSFSLDDKLVHAEGGQPVQNPLISAVAALGKPMVVVLEGGSVIDMPWLPTVPAVVMAWYPGEDGGDALAGLLFGKKNFSGKLPVTWPNPIVGTCPAIGPGTRLAPCPSAGPCPACFGDEPLFSAGPGQTTPVDYYSGYRYYDQMQIKPLFAFGHGMSYTTFQYGTVASMATAGISDTVTISVPVTNTGTVAGDEVSFLFVSYPNTKRVGHTNVKELKGFARTPDIAPGATTVVQIPLRIADLKYWDTPTGKWVVEAGAIDIMVGGSSDNLPSTSSLTVN
jgi:beta-glucosidase